MREQQKHLLVDVLAGVPQHDQNVVVVGDSNIKVQEIQKLVESIGLAIIALSGQEGIRTTHACNRYERALISSHVAGEEVIRPVSLFSEPTARHCQRACLTMWR